MDTLSDAKKYIDVQIERTAVKAYIARKSAEASRAKIVYESAVIEEQCKEKV